MRFSKHLGALAFAAALAAAPSAFAAHIQNCFTGWGGGITGAATFSCSANVIGTGDAIVGNIAYGYSGAVPSISISDDKGNTYTVLDTTGPNYAWNWIGKSFALYNITNGPHTITVTVGGTGANNPSIMWEEYSNVSATDVHTGQFQSQVSTNANSVTSGNVTTTVANDVVWGSSVNQGSADESSAGAGFTARFTGAGASDWGQQTEDKTAGAVGSVVPSTFTTSVTDDFMTYVIAMKPTPVPTAVNCTPNVLTSSSVTNAVVCNFTVTMSDGSAFSGTTAVAPTSLFKIVGSAAELARNLSASDVGTATMTLSATQGGVTKSTNFNVQINSASVAGTPYAIGWKNIDPGVSATDGPGIVTFGKTGTVTQIALRVAVPTGSAALLDVYRAQPNQACASGSLLHTGDLDANHPADSVQLVSGSNLTNTSVAVGDTLCLVTHQPFPATGQATLTVTVN